MAQNSLFNFIKEYLFREKATIYRVDSCSLVLDHSKTANDDDEYAEPKNNPWPSRARGL